MDLEVHSYAELIRLPYLRYIQYLSIIENFNIEEIFQELSIIGIDVADIDKYVDYYRKWLYGENVEDIPYLTLGVKHGALLPYKKNLQNHLMTALSKLGFTDMYKDENYYVRYILLHPKLREMINELGLKKIQTAIVLSILKDWGNIIIPKSELELYYKYFWDFSSMAIDDWYSFLESIKDVEIRDRYVDILSNDASYILAEYDYSENLETASVVGYTFKTLFLRFRRLAEMGNNDDAILKYAEMIRKFATDMYDKNTRESDEIQALLAMLTDAQVGYKQIEDVFGKKEGEGTAEQHGKSGLEEGLLDLNKVELPDE